MCAGCVLQLGNLAALEDKAMLRSHNKLSTTSKKIVAQLTSSETQAAVNPVAETKSPPVESVAVPDESTKTPHEAKTLSLATPHVRKGITQSTEKKSKDSAEKLATREALLDPEVAARALHTPNAKPLRNRSIPIV